MPPLPPPDESAGGIVGGGLWGKFVSMAFLVMFFFNGVSSCLFHNEQRDDWRERERRADERERVRRAEMEQRR